MKLVPRYQYITERPPEITLYGFRSNLKLYIYFRSIIIIQIQIVQRHVQRIYIGVQRHVQRISDIRAAVRPDAHTGENHSQFPTLERPSSASALWRGRRDRRGPVPRVRRAGASPATLPPTLTRSLRTATLPCVPTANLGHVVTCGSHVVAMWRQQQRRGVACVAAANDGNHAH